MEKNTRIRDSVYGAPVGIVIEAQSESIAAAGRMEKGRRIGARAAQLETTHCLVVGDVIYFSNTGGISLAAQFEKGIGGLAQSEQSQQVCVPFDEMVYLCRYADGLVSQERCLVPARAREALQSCDEPVLVFPAGRLGESFASSGKTVPVTVLRLRGFGNPYLFRSTLACLLYHGMPMPQHGIRGVLALSVLLAAFIVAVQLREDSTQLSRQVQQVIPMVPAELPAAASPQLRAFSRAVHRLVPIASWLGLREIRLRNSRLVLTGSPGGAAPGGAGARYLGFEQAHWDTEKFEWHAPLAATAARSVTPPPAAAAAQFLEQLRHATGIEVIGMQRRNTITTAVMELELHIGTASAYSLEQLAALVGALPSSLRAASLHYGADGLPEAASLALAVHTRRR